MAGDMQMGGLPTIGAGPAGNGARQMPTLPADIERMQRRVALLTLAIQTPGVNSGGDVVAAAKAYESFVLDGK